MIRNMCLDNRYIAPPGLVSFVESVPGTKVPGYYITLLRSMMIVPKGHNIIAGGFNHRKRSNNTSQTPKGRHKMEQMDNQTETKKISTGKIGLILTLLVPLSITLPLIISLIPPMRIVGLMLLFIPPILYFLSLIYCAHGFKKKRSRKLATTGLIIHLLIIVILFVLFIPLTPTGSMPYPLNI